MLNLRIVRGPLPSSDEEVILREFNRLTNSTIPVGDFRRWIRESPGGPAWHALLESDQGGIVGHFSLIPLQVRRREKTISTARTEYFFVHEQFRSEKVRGFENSVLPCGLLLLDRLYRTCREQGWNPSLASASDEIQPFHRAVGCRPADFALSECLLILRPWAAARLTPNLRTKQRLALFLVGIGQCMVWSLARLLFRIPPSVKSVSPTSLCIHSNADLFTFFADPDGISWRYPDEQYLAVASESDPHQFVIAKRGSDARYLRVCDWQLENHRDAMPFVSALIGLARVENSLGVRWSIYGDRQPALLRFLRKLGFLCVARSRRLLLYTKEEDFLDPANWNMNDSFFSFDL